MKIQYYNDWRSPKLGIDLLDFSYSRFGNQYVVRLALLGVGIMFITNKKEE